MFNEFNSYGSTTPSYLHDIPPAVAKANEALLKAGGRGPAHRSDLLAKLRASNIKKNSKKKAPSVLGWYYGGLKAKILIPTAVGLYAYRTYVSDKRQNKLEYAKAIGAGAVYMPYLIYVVGKAAYDGLQELRK